MRDMALDTACTTWQTSSLNAPPPLPYGGMATVNSWASVSGARDGPLQGKEKEGSCR